MKIDLKQEITDFVVLSNDLQFGHAKVQQDFFFPTDSDKIANDRCIMFNILNQEIVIDLCKSNEYTFFFRMAEPKLKIETLKQLADIFNFKLTPNSLHPEFITGSLDFNHKYEGRCDCIFFDNGEIEVIVIYASHRDKPARSAGEDFYGNNIFYIHGIWQVKTSSDFRDKILG